MNKKAVLVLEDGSVYEGESFGAETFTYGEVVFNTSMTGYQEMLTDPSYAGQIVTITYPIIGSYGINEFDFESRRVQLRAFVVREDCETPSHYLSKKTINEYLVENDIPGISGVDTRALTRKLRSAGVMMGILTSSKTPSQALEELKHLPNYGAIDFVKEVSTKAPYEWENASLDHDSPHVVVLDCGAKYSILRNLHDRGAKVTVVPCTTSAEEILSLRPNGVLLSPGPGNPELLDYIVETVKGLLGKKPVMGICLGNQIIARAFGAKTFKLKYGHRGSNHPVKELSSGKVLITSQNHGYAVDPDTLPPELVVSHINLNDGTVEGLYHKELPVFCIQYHSEAAPGPLDSAYLFERFLEMVVKGEK